MSAPGRVAMLELRASLRSPITLGALLLGLAAGTLALAHGRAVIDRQQRTLHARERLQAEQHRAVLATQPPTARAGDQLYYLFFHTAHEPSDWAPFALGQRDVQPCNLKVRLLALQGQLHEADLVSPLLAASGNFDAAFVLVMLAPLLVIALSYDLVSAEREGGTWDLARAQGLSEVRLAGLKLAVRTSLAAAPFALLLLAAPALLGVGWGSRWLAVAASVAAYLAFWAAAAAAVAALGRGSGFNLLALCTTWLAVAVVGPALVNSYAALRAPVAESLELAVLQRHGYHSAWDRPLQETMDAFYVRYPEWRGSAVPIDTYSNAWYYAMQQRGDAAAEPAYAAYLAAIERRHALVRRLGALLPSLTLDRQLLAVARTDVDSHLGYLRSVADYHESLKRFFQPAIFDGRPITQVRWSEAPRHSFRDREAVPLLQAPAVLLLQVLSMAALALLLPYLARRGRSARTAGEG